MKNNALWKNTLLAAIVIAVVVLIPCGLVHAQTATSANVPVTTTPLNPYSCGFTSLGTCIPFLLFYLMWAFVSIFVSLGVWLVTTFLTLNGAVFSSPAVQVGFGIALGLANLGFVLGIIVIAIATILRNQTYGMKQILWKLIAVAILVNFGLVIAKPIVAFSDSMTAYFEKAIGGSTNNFATVVASAFNQQKLLPTPAKGQTATQQQAVVTACQDDVGFDGLSSNPSTQCQQAMDAANNKSTGDTFVGDMISLLFACVFSFVVVIALLSLAALLIVRYVYLAMLLILLPLAWATYPFPKFSSHFSKWWDDFIKWTFFPVMAMFFMYLAFLAAGQNNPNAVNYLNSAAPAMSGSTLVQNPAGTFIQDSSNGASGPSVLQTALDATVLCGLMIGGLFAAASLTGKAGQVVVNAGKSASGAVTGYAKRKTKAKAQSVGRNVADRTKGWGKQYNPETRETTTRLQRWGSKLQNVPGFIPGARKLGTAMANTSAPAAIQKNKEKEVQDYVDNNLKSLTNDGIIARATSKTAFLNPTQSAAIAQELARRDLTTHKDVKPLMGKYVAAADRVGSLDKVTNNRPDLMPKREVMDAAAPGGKRMETEAEAVARAIKSAEGDVVQANGQIFNYANPGTAATKLGLPPAIAADILRTAVLSLNPGQLGALGSDMEPGSQERKNNITNALKQLIASNTALRKEIEKKEADKDPITGKPTGTYTMVKTGQYEINDAEVTRLATLGMPEYKNLEAIVKHMKSSPNWEDVLK